MTSTSLVVALLEYIKSTIDAGGGGTTFLYRLAIASLGHNRAAAIWSPKTCAILSIVFVGGLAYFSIAIISAPKIVKLGYRIGKKTTLKPKSIVNFCLKCYKKLKKFSANNKQEFQFLAYSYSLS